MGLLCQRTSAFELDRSSGQRTDRARDFSLRADGRACLSRGAYHHADSVSAAHLQQSLEGRTAAHQMTEANFPLFSVCDKLLARRIRRAGLLDDTTLLADGACLRHSDQRRSAAATSVYLNVFA